MYKQRSKCNIPQAYTHLSSKITMKHPLPTRFQNQTYTLFYTHCHSVSTHAPVHATRNNIQSMATASPRWVIHTAGGTDATFIYGKFITLRARHACYIYMYTYRYIYAYNVVYICGTYVYNARAYIRQSGINSLSLSRSLSLSLSLTLSLSLSPSLSRSLSLSLALSHARE